MIKILVIGLSSEMGGTENYIYNLVQRLDKTKFNMDFLVIDEGRCTPYQNEINKYFDDGRNHFYYCPNIKKSMITGIKWLKHFYSNNYYDVIYMNATTSARIAYCQYAIRKFKTPIITHSHRSDGSKINHYICRHYVTEHSKFKLACSNNAAEWMFGKKEKNYILISNGIIAEKFKFNKVYRDEIRNELDISDDKYIIGHVGRFSEEKNHDFFIKLAKKLDKRYVFLLIGEGPIKDEFKMKINNENLDSKFRILDGTKLIYKYYSAMDVFMMPSFNEGLPIVSVEAQCNGLHCIFSDTISDETNISGKCKYLPLNSVDEWVTTLESQDYTRFDGVKVIKNAGFDMEKSASIVAQLFEKAIQN